MTVKVESIGYGVMKDANGNLYMYEGDGDSNSLGTITADIGDKKYYIVDYDEFDDPIELIELKTTVDGVLKIIGCEFGDLLTDAGELYSDTYTAVLDTYYSLTERLGYGSSEATKALFPNSPDMWEDDDEDKDEETSCKGCDDSDCQSC